MQQELKKWQRLANNIQKGLEESQSDSLSELSTYDNHPADLGAETFERSKDLSLLERARTRIESLEAALSRLEAGGFGICRRCGKAISQQRLEAIPEAELCTDCQKHTESDSSVRKRPLEEKHLSVPFARTFTRQHSPGFDGEDAWQTVARFGTSDGPQDLPGAVTYHDLVSDEDLGAVEKVETLPSRAENNSSSQRKRKVKAPKNK